MRVEQNQNNYERKMVEAKKAVAKAGNIPEKGDVIRGAIQDIKGQQVKILLANSQVVEARLTQNFGFVIGQDVSLLVKDATPEQLVLTPMMDEQAALEGKLLSILEQADLKPSDNNIEIVKALMVNEMPVNKEMINQVAKAMYKFPDLALKDIVFMLKNDIPVTPENVSNYTALTEGNPVIFSQLESIVSGLSDVFQEQPDMVRQIADTLPNNQAIQELTQFLQVGSKAVVIEQGKEVLLQTNILSDPIISHGNPILLNEAISEVNNLLNELGKPLIHEGMSLIEVEALIDDIGDDLVTTKIKTLLVKPMFEQQTRQALFLNFEQIKDSTEIKQYFTKLYDQVSSLSQQLENTELPENIKDEASAAKQGLEFIRTLNQNYQFMELPFIVDDQLQDGRLYVLNNKARKHKNPSSVSVLMQLDFLNLKHLDIYINKQDNQVDLEFYTSTRAIKEAIEQPMAELQTILSDKGYKLRHIGVHVREEKVDIREKFLEMDNDHNDLKHMSFDIRV